MYVMSASFTSHNHSIQLLLYNWHLLQTFIKCVIYVNISEYTVYNVVRCICPQLQTLATSPVISIEQVYSLKRSHKIYLLLYIFRAPNVNWISLCNVFSFVDNSINHLKNLYQVSQLQMNSNMPTNAGSWLCYDQSTILCLMSCNCLHSHETGWVYSGYWKS